MIQSITPPIIVRGLVRRDIRIEPIALNLGLSLDKGVTGVAVFHGSVILFTHINTEIIELFHGLARLLEGVDVVLMPQRRNNLD